MANQTRLPWIVFFGLMGATASVIPALIPHFSAAMEIDVFLLLNAVPFLFAGLFLGILINPLISNRLGFEQIMKLASPLLAAGLVVIVFSNQAQWFFAGAFLAGIGFGLAEVSITSQVRKEVTDTTKMMTKLTAVFAVSAMVTPVLLIIELQLNYSYWLLLVLAIAVSITGLVVRAELLAPNKGTYLFKVHSQGFVFLIIAGLYVGAESVMAGWASTVLDQANVLSTEFTPIASSAFWGLIASGRLFSLWSATRFLNDRAFSIWPVVSAAGLVAGAAVFIANPMLALIGFGISVFAAGPIYGQIISSALKTVESAKANSFTTMLIVCGAAGGFLIPAAVQLAPSIANAAWFSAAAMLVVSISYFFNSKNLQANKSEVMQ